MRSAPSFPPARDREGAWSTGPGAQRLHQRGAHSNFAATGAQIATEGEGLAGILLSNTAAAVVWFQFFFAHENEITLGTTRPDISLALNQNSSQHLEWDHPLGCPRGCWVYATTDQANAVGAANGHTCTATLATTGAPGDDFPRQAPIPVSYPRTSSPGSAGYRYGDFET